MFEHHNFEKFLGCLQEDGWEELAWIFLVFWSPYWRTGRRSGGEDCWWTEKGQTVRQAGKSKEGVELSTRVWLGGGILVKLVNFGFKIFWKFPLLLLRGHILLFITFIRKVFLYFWRENLFFIYEEYFLSFGKKYPKLIHFLQMPHHFHLKNLKFVSLFPYPFPFFSFLFWLISCSCQTLYFFTHLLKPPPLWIFIANLGRQVRFLLSLVGLLSDNPVGRFSWKVAVEFENNAEF